MKSLSPFKSRDFVMQRSWLDNGSEKYLCAHSVWHDVIFFFNFRKIFVINFNLGIKIVQFLSKKFELNF